MYSVSETIEDENIYVTSHPGIWCRENTLLWPPEGSGIDRKNIVAPGPDWKPYKCKILRDNIETFEEALELEQRYSKHRDSDSFRKENERKKFKRDHPVDANLSDLIDLNEVITKINADKAALNVGDEASSKHTNKYHNQCFEARIPKNTVISGPKKTSISVPKKTVFSGPKKTVFSGPKKIIFSGPKKTVFSGPKKNRILNSSMKSELSKAVKTPRYPNYLKSGNKSTAPSSTITKKVYLKLNGLPSEETTVGKELHVRENGGRISDKQEQLDNTASSDKRGIQISSTPGKVHPSVQNYSFSCESDDEVERNNVKIGTQFSSTPFEVKSNAQNVLVSCKSNPKVDRNYAKNDKAISKPIILDDVIIKQGGPSSIDRSSSFEESVLRSLNELKNAQKKSEEKQTLFEARMIIKYDTFVNEILQTQGRTQSRGQSQHLEPIREFHQVYKARRVEEDFDDFDDFDQNFPIKAKSGVEELEWNIRTNLEFKFRLKCRANDFISKGPKKTIRLIMKYLIQDKVLERFCWNGTSEKAPFKKLISINNFIYNFLRENFKKYKKFQYQSYMGQWLKHAKSRQRKVTYTYPNRNDETDDEENEDENDEDNNDDNDEEGW